MISLFVVVLIVKFISKLRFPAHTSIFLYIESVFVFMTNGSLSVENVSPKAGGIEKLYEILLLRQKQHSLISDVFKLQDWPFQNTLGNYYKLKTFFILVP